MPVTAKKGYSVQTAGSNLGTWGAGTSASLNEGVIDIVDSNMGGLTTLTLSSVNVALSQAQANNAKLRLTGTLTADVQISPDTGVLFNGFYFVENATTGAHNVTITNGVASAVVPQNDRSIIFVDSVNGVSIYGIASNSTTPPVQVLTPSGGDDWPTVYAALVANAYVRPVMLQGGLWHCDSFAGSGSVNLPSGSVLICEPGVIIESTLTPSGGQTTSVFSNVPVKPSGATDTTLSAQANEGDTTLTLASVAIGGSGANVAVGDTILVTNLANMASYFIVQTVNTSSKVVGLDRPLVTTYAVGATVGVRAVPTDIHILGNGMTIRGTGDRAINLTAAYHSHIEDVNVGPNTSGQFFSDTPVAFDIGSRFSEMRDMKIDNDGQGLSCISMEGAESCTYDNLVLENSGHTLMADLPGLFLACSYYNKVSNVTIISCREGILLSSGGVDAYGSRHNEFVNVSIESSTIGAAVHVQNGSSFNKFANLDLTRAATFGILIGGGLDVAEQTRDNVFQGMVINNCAKGAIFVDNTVSGAVVVAPKDNVFENFTSDSCGTIGDGVSVGVTLGGRSIMSNAVITNAANQGFALQTGDQILNNITLDYTANGNWTGIIQTTSGKVTLNGLVANGGGTGTKVIFTQQDGLLVYDNIVATGAWSDGYVANNSNAKSRAGQCIDFQVCTTPFDRALGTHNVGLSTLVSGTVTVANSLIASSDVPVLTRRNIPASPGHLAVNTITAGTSFTIVSSNAADSGTVAWRF